jgi:hypothetical protein
LRNKVISFGIVIILVITTVLIIFITKNNKTNKTESINRYEWMSLLCEYEGISDYDKSEPYYNDVDSNNDSFKYIQSAVEWSVLDGKGRFDGEDFATGKFMALTSMKAIGEEGLQFYLGEQSELSEKEYLNVAVELGLISKSDYKKKYTLDEAQEFLDKLDEIRYSTLWVDDYENISYKDGVTRLTSDDLISYSPESEQITVSNSVETSNGVIVFEYNGYIIARKIVSNIGDNTYSLETPTLEEVADEIVISDIDTIDFSDILNFYGDDFVQVASENTGVPVSKTISKDLTSPGFKIKAEETDGLLIVTVTDNATGKKYAMKNLSQCEIEGFSAELNVENIFVGTQLKYKGGSVEYVKFATDIDSDIESSIEGETEKTIKLFETPAPLGTGIVGVNIEFGLQLTLNGEMTLTANIPFENTVMYEKGKGVRNIKHNLSVEKPTFDVSAEAGAYLDLSSTLVAFQAVDIIDAALDVGITANGESVYRDNGMVCADLGIGFPIVKVSVCKDEETLLSSIINEKSWDVVDYDHAKIKYNAHAEALPNGTHQIVDECTYVEGQVLAPALDNTYTTQLGQQYSIDYPNNWTLDTAVNEQFGFETFTLKNVRGVEIVYLNQVNKEFYGDFDSATLGGWSGYWYKASSEKVGESQLSLDNVYWRGTQSNDYGELLEDSTFIVSYVSVYSSKFDDGYTAKPEEAVSSPNYFAVVPALYIGEMEFDAQQVANEFCWNYPDVYTATALYATSPDGEFTDDEEEEIIQILASFRTSE